MSVFKRAMDAGAVSTNRESICEECGNKRMMFKWKDIERCSECVADYIDAQNGTAPKKTVRKKGISASVQRFTEAVTGSGKGKVFGKLMVWSLAEVEMLVDELEGLCERTIGSQYMPTTPGKKRALRRALRAIESDGLIRKIRDDEIMIAYGLVEEIPDVEAIDLDLNKLNIIIFDKATEHLEFRGNHKNDEIRQLFELYSEVYTTEDVRKMVIAYIKEQHGISVREQGGTYYLRNVEHAETAQAFIQGLNSGSQALLFSVFDDAGSRDAVGNLAKEAIQRELELLAEEIKVLIADNASETVLGKRLEKFKNLRKKAKIYQDCMKEDVEVLRENLDVLQGEVQEAFEGKLADYPQSKEFPYQIRVKYKGSKKDKYGEWGTVVGYSTAKKTGMQYVKVLMDKTDEVKPFGTSTLIA